MNAIFSRVRLNIDIITAIIFTVLLITIIFKFNIFVTIDGDIHLSWSYFWNQQLITNRAYPQWFEAAFGGLGSTSFIFYPPLFKIIGTPFALLNLSPVQQVKGSLIAIIVINSLGTFKLTRSLFDKNKISSLIAISLGIFNPYMIIEITKNGGFPRVCAMAIIPWIVLAIKRCFDSEATLISHLYLTLIFALLFANNIPFCLVFGSGYFFSVFLLVFFSQVSLRKALATLILPFIGGIIVDSYFLLPILFDINNVHQAFVPNFKVVQNKLFFNQSLSFGSLLVNSHVEKNINSLFVNSIVVFLIALPTFFSKKNIKSIGKDVVLRLMFWSGVFSLMMMTSLSLPLYQNSSIFRKLQFPYRYLSVVCCYLPYTLAYFISRLRLNTRIYLTKISVVILYTLILILNYKSIGFILRNQNQSSLVVNNLLTNPGDRVKIEKIGENENTTVYPLGDKYSYIYVGGKAVNIFFADENNRLFINDVEDYIPDTVPIEKKWLTFPEPKFKQKNLKLSLPNSYEDIEITKGLGTYKITQWGREKREFQIDAKTDISFNLKTFYYPGWKVKVNSLPDREFIDTKLLASTDGRIMLNLPQGNYDIDIWYRGTNAQIWGRKVSFASILAIIALGFNFKLKSYTKKSY